MKPERLFRVEEAADLLALRPGTVRKMILRREISVVRPTRRAVRVAESELVRIQRDGLSPRRGESR
jgi:excisionase family DNA binding protein